MRIAKVIFMLSIFAAIPALAQGPPPRYAPPQLDQMVSRIALYPDSLVAQILAAATYPDQIPDAAHWADEHHYLRGQELANAIQNDQVPWDPSVQALLPFPSVLEMMARDMDWTTNIGNTFLAQQQDVMDAVQRERHRAYQYGYLRSNGQVVVSGGPYITIAPVNPAFVLVPWYDPGVVFFPPRPGIVVGGAIRFGFGVTLGAFFRPWGWGYDRFDWGRHVVIVNNAPWRRDWDNRREYMHPYADVHRWGPGDRGPEHHELEERSPHERQEEREGRGRPEEHGDHGNHGEHGGDHGDHGDSGRGHDHR